MEELNEALRKTRTDSAFRRAIEALVGSEQIKAAFSWFTVSGSLMANTASTVEMPDVDLSASCDLRPLIKAEKLRIEETTHGYYKVRLLNPEANLDAVVQYLESSLYHLATDWEATAIARAEADGGRRQVASIRIPHAGLLDWFTEGDFCLSTAALRNLLKTIGSVIDATTKNTSAAASGSLAAKPRQGSNACKIRDAFEVT